MTTMNRHAMESIGIQPATRLLAEKIADEAIRRLMADGSVSNKWLWCDDVEGPAPICELAVDTVNQREQNVALVTYVRQNRPDSMFMVWLARGPSRDGSDGLVDGVLVIVAERGQWPRHLFARRGESATTGEWCEAATGFYGGVWAAMADGYVEWRNASEWEEAAASIRYEMWREKKAVRDMISFLAVTPPDRQPNDNPVGSSDKSVDGDLVRTILESNPTIRVASGFRETCWDAIGDIVRALDEKVADIIDEFPETTFASRYLYRSVVVSAGESCYATVTKLLDEYIHSPAYQGDKSWATMEEAVIAKAVAGDRAAQKYVESHDHLPEHPGKPWWTGREWTDDPPEISGERDPWHDDALEQFDFGLWQDAESVYHILSGKPSLTPLARGTGG